jgi:apolipoprotein N-acyltransferase
MQQLFEYYGRFQGFRGNLLGLPAWARMILFVLALPGILLLSLSIVAVVGSLAALFLLTVPAYRLLKAMTVRPTEASSPVDSVVLESPGRRHVDVRIIE